MISAHTLSLHFLWLILVTYVLRKCCVPAGVVAALRAKCAVVVAIVVVFDLYICNITSTLEFGPNGTDTI